MSDEKGSKSSKGSKSTRQNVFSLNYQQYLVWLKNSKCHDCLKYLVNYSIVCPTCAEKEELISVNYGTVCPTCVQIGKKEPMPVNYGMVCLFCSGEEESIPDGW